MSRLFISHNSQDALAAAALKHWLADSGWGDVFLDIDARDGLNPGERWRDALRTAADRCEAVLCLVSPAWLASPECKLEFRYAETLRKHVFLAIIKPCEKAELPPDWQWCPLYGGGAQTTIRFQFREQPAECSFLSDGLQRLKNGLAKAGIGAEHFPWPPENDPNRAPYRGLKPLEAADAAVFFGRNAQILHGMETLCDMRRTGIKRLLVILGASGSGKSSFMRAGLLPRLARDDRQFFPLPVIRPRKAILFGAEGLAPALAAAFAGLGSKLTLGEIEKWLAAGSEAVDAMLDRLERRLRERIADNATLPSLVFPIDQAEELFSADGATEAAQFLAFLGQLLTDRDAAGGSAVTQRRALVMLTIRSDRYEWLQAAPGLSEIKPRLFDLRPFPPGQFERVINGPAERATAAGRKLKIEPRLTERLLTDFAEGADTLPLLGFALEKLYTKYGGDGDLTLEEYEAIRGNAETVQAAIFQEAIDSALAEPYRPPVISAERSEQYQGLRRAFIPYLARINPESNEPMRQVAKLADLPADLHPLVERLVEARLLIRDKDGIEVTHESILRQWPSLRGWLTEDLDKLRLLENIRQSAAEWHKENRHEELLVHRDGRLKDAEALLATPGYVVAADSDERAYLNACTAAQQAREAGIKEEQERRIRDAERIAAEQTKTAAVQRRAAQATLIGLVVAVLVAGLAVWQYFEAERETQRATAGRLAIAADKEKTHSIDLALLLANEAVKATSPDRLRSSWLGRFLELASEVVGLRQPEPTTEAQSALLSALLRAPRLTKIFLAPIDRNRIDRGRIRTIAISPPDGKRLAAATGSTVRLWDTESGQPLGVSLVYEGLVDVTALAFSPDGKRLASASFGSSKDNAVHLWDAQSGRPLAAPLAGHESDIRLIAFSPDSKRLASATQTTFRLWDAETGQLIGTPLRDLDYQTGFIVALSPDLKRIVTETNDGVRFRDAESGKLIGEPHKAHDGRVRSAIFSADGTRLATGGYDGTVQLWTAETGEPLGTAKEGHDSTVSGLAFSPDGIFLVSVSENDKTVRIWNAFDTGPAPVESFEGHQDGVQGITFGPDGKSLLSFDSRSIRLWNAENGQPLSTVISRYEVDMEHVAFSPDYKRLASVSRDNTARIWQVVPGRPIDAPLRELASFVTGVAFSPDGKHLATGHQEGTVEVWDIESGKPLTDALKGHKAAIRGLAFSRDGRQLASGGNDATVRIWDIERGKSLNPPLLGHEGPIVWVAFGPGGRRLLSASRDRTIRLWDAGGGKPLGVPIPVQVPAEKGFAFFSPDGQHLVPEDSYRSVAFSSDGRRLASANSRDNRGLRLLNAQTGKPIGEPFRDDETFSGSWSVAFVSDSKRLASVSYDGNVRLWDIRSGNPFPTLEREANGATTIAASPDSRRLVTGNLQQGIVRLWDEEMALPIGVLDSQYRVSSIAFSSDGKRLACATDSGIVLWDVDPHSWQRRACAIANRNLTHEEWRKYMGGQSYRKTCPDLPGPADDTPKVAASQAAPGASKTPPPNPASAPSEAPGPKPTAPSITQPQPEKPVAR